MINKQKTESRPCTVHKQPIDALFRRLINLRGVPSPNKLLKYNYKQSVDKMQQNSLKSRSSLTKIPYTSSNDEQMQQNKGQETQGTVIKGNQKRSFTQSNFTTNQNTQLLFQDKKQRYRHRSVSFCKSATEHTDQHTQGHIKLDKKQIQNEKNKLNPYTKSEYLYVRNQSRDQAMRQRVINQNKCNFGLNIEKSCKIISFELINPLQKYDKAEKVYKTNSTLPQCFFDQQQEQRCSNQIKIQSRQMPISQRKKSGYYKQLKQAQGSFSYQSNSKNIHSKPIFSDFEPSPWQSSVKNCDLFYLKVQQL